MVTAINRTTLRFLLLPAKPMRAPSSARKQTPPRRKRTPRILCDTHTHTHTHTLTHTLTHSLSHTHQSLHYSHVRTIGPNDIGPVGVRNRLLVACGRVSQVWLKFGWSVVGFWHCLWTRSDSKTPKMRCICLPISFNRCGKFHENQWTFA